MARASATANAAYVHAVRSRPALSLNAARLRRGDEIGKAESARETVFHPVLARMPMSLKAACFVRESTRQRQSYRSFRRCMSWRMSCGTSQVRRVPPLVVRQKKKKKRRGICRGGASGQMFSRNTIEMVKSTTFPISSQYHGLYCRTALRINQVVGFPKPRSGWLFLSSTVRALIGCTSLPPRDPDNGSAI